MRTALALLVATGIVLGQQQGKRPDQGAGIEAGKDAADFKLLRLNDDPKAKEEHVQLSSFKGKQAVLLIFGSYT